MEGGSVSRLFDFQKGKGPPSRMGVAHPRLYGTLASIAEAAGLPIPRCGELLSLAAAKEFLLDYAKE